METPTSSSQHDNDDDTSWKKGTFVMVKGLQSEAGAKINGSYGITVGKAITATGGDDNNKTTTRYPVFLFAKKKKNINRADDDDKSSNACGDEVEMEMEAILVDAQAKKIKLVNLIKLVPDDDNSNITTTTTTAAAAADGAGNNTAKIWELFRESALNHIHAAQESDHITNQHAYLAELCYQKTSPPPTTTKKKNGEEEEKKQDDDQKVVVVDVDANLLLAFCLLLKPKTKQQDNVRVVKLLEPLTAQVIMTDFTKRFHPRKLGLHVSQLLSHAAKWSNEPTKHFQQALECALLVGNSDEIDSIIIDNDDDNNNPNNNNNSEEEQQHEETEDPAEEQKHMAVGALLKVGGSASEFLEKLRNRDVHPGVQEVLKRAYENAIRLDPTNEDLIATMGHIYVQLKDYVKAAQWYRKTLDTISPEVAIENSGLPNIIEDWTASLVLSQLQIEGMPLNGVCIMHPMTQVGGQPMPSSSSSVMGGSQPPRVWRCVKYASDMMPMGPDGGAMMMSTSPPFDYTIPTTDPNDPNVFPSWLLEMVNPERLDIVE